MELYVRYNVQEESSVVLPGGPLVPTVPLTAPLTQLISYERRTMKPPIQANIGPETEWPPRCCSTADRKRSGSRLHWNTEPLPDLIDCLLLPEIIQVMDGPVIGIEF